MWAAAGHWCIQCVCPHLSMRMCAPASLLRTPVFQASKIIFNLSHLLAIDTKILTDPTNNQFEPTILREILDREIFNENDV